MAGLAAGTSSRTAVLGGIITIAIADALSDALGIHISEESKFSTTKNQVWEATGATFFTKFLFASTFAIPVFFMELSQAVMVNIIWGTLVLAVMSYFIAKEQNSKPLHVITEHISIALLVIFITDKIGGWIAYNL